MRRITFRRVVRVEQSKLDPTEWFFKLECGHKISLTMRRPPVRVPQRLICERCGRVEPSTERKAVA